MATSIKCEKAQGNNANQVRITLLKLAQKDEDQTLVGEVCDLCWNQWKSRAK
jgi:hypothetical protein